MKWLESCLPFHRHGITTSFSDIKKTAVELGYNQCDLDKSEKSGCAIFGKIDAAFPIRTACYVYVDFNNIDINYIYSTIVHESYHSLQHYLNVIGCNNGFLGEIPSYYLQKTCLSSFDYIDCIIEKKGNKNENKTV